MTAGKPDPRQPASGTPGKPTDIELTEEDLKRVSGGKGGKKK